MSEVINLENSFEDWFHEVESFGLKSERFFDSLGQFSTKEALFASLQLWLKAAYMHGIKTAAQDSIKTLAEYSTAVEGVESYSKDYTLSGAFDTAAENLDAYWNDVLKDK